VNITRIRVNAFGRLRGLDSGPETLPGLIVVTGPNEAGKSTLFHFLTSMLYGFHPASREGNPYTPWGEGDPSGSVTLNLESGGCVEVERRLRSQPTAQLSGSEGAEELRNRPVPWVEHVPRAVFRQVFAVTLAELASLDGEAWDRVQDRIIGSMGASDLLPARQVAGELEREAGELWRPTRRGNQRIRDLQDRLLALRERRRVAAENDRHLRAVVAQVADLREELQDARQARHDTLAELDRLQELVPVHRQLQRISALEADAGASRLLDGLPRDPATDLSTWEARVRTLRERLADVAAERQAPSTAVEAFDDEARALLSQQDRIRSFLGRVGGLGPERARLAALEQEARDLDRRLGTAVEKVLAPSAADPDTEALSRISLTELRERVRIARTIREERLLIEASTKRPPESLPKRPAWWGPALLAPGATFLGLGIAGGDVLATAVGAALSAIGVLWIVRWLAQRSRGSGTRDHAGGLAEMSKREAEARAAVGELFGDLPLHPYALDRPSDALVAVVERVGELMRDRTERLRAAQELRLTVEAVDADASDIATSLGIHSGVAGAPAVAHVLDEAVRDAERTRQAAASAERELARLHREEERLRRELGSEEAALTLLRDRIAAAGDGDVSLGARVLKSRLEARDRARQLRDELDRSYPHLDQLRDAIASAVERHEPWTEGERPLSLLKDRMEEQTEEVERLAAQVKAMERDAEHLRDVEPVDAVDGEATTLQEEIASLLRERDRRWVLAHLLREADRKFREEHQPDLMRRAGQHLAHLTDGRYDRIIADEANTGDRFQIHGPSLPGPIPLVPPVSTGTLEQAYLALRLAIVDHLDQGHERLPLFVDEVFVNWDRERRLRGMKVLAGIARRRQLFVFTCHQEVANELGALGARVLVLDGSE
jgi:uncharacterized protein YhaN